MPMSPIQAQVLTLLLALRRGAAFAGILGPGGARSGCSSCTTIRQQLTTGDDQVIERPRLFGFRTHPLSSADSRKSRRVPEATTSATDRKSTRLNSSHQCESRMLSSAYN